MPRGNEDAEKLGMLWIRDMDEKLRDKPKRKYIIIYHYALSQNNNGFEFLNDLYKKLPLQYYAML